MSKEMTVISKNLKNILKNIKLEFKTEQTKQGP